MKEFLEVLKYTFSENLRKKSFVISTVIILVIIVALMAVPAIISSIKTTEGANSSDKSESTEPKKVVYVVDNSSFFTDKLAVIQQAFPDYDFKNERTDKVETIKSDIKANGEKYLLIVDVEKDLPKLSYFTKQYGDGPDPDDISKVFRNIYSNTLLQKENVPQDTITKTLSDINVNINELGKSKIGAIISSILIVIILFFAIYFYGYGVSMSVASEKTSRVMEILVTSVKPSRIILGKTAGMGLLGLLQLMSIIVVGGVTYKLAFPGDFKIGGMSVDLSGFTPFSLAMVILYFILGYALFALMYAVVGATVDKAEDVQSAMMPMNLGAVICFYFSYGTFSIPDSAAAKIASFIPFTAPFSVPSRLMSTDVPLWQLAISLGLLIAAIIVVGTASVKLYSFAVLHYGDRLKIGKLFEMSKTEKLKVKA